MSQPPAPDTERFDITVPRSTEWRPTTAASFAKALYDQSGEKELLLTIQATSDNLKWVIDQNPQTPIFTHQSLIALVNQFYPGASVKESPKIPAKYPLHRRYIIFALQAAELFELFTPITARARYDPLYLVAQTMSQLQPEEYLRYTVQAVGVTQQSEEAINEILTMSAYDAGYRTKTPTLPLQRDNALPAVVNLINQFIVEPRGNKKLKEERVWRFDERKIQEYLSKLHQKIGFVCLSLMFDTPYKNRLDFVTPIASAVKDLNSDGNARISDGAVRDLLIRSSDEDTGQWLVDLLRYDDIMKKFFDLMYNYAAKPPGQIINSYIIPMTAEEIACMWHLPHSGFEGLKISWPASFPPQVAASGRKGEIPIGTIQNDTLITVNRTDRKHHAYVTGKTGMGKTNLLHNLIHQDIISGCGVAVIDPHGTLIKDVLETSITPRRLDDVVYLRCADTQYPVPLNPLRSPPGVSEVAMFNTVLWIIKSIYKDSWSETRMETTYRNILQVVLADPEATPLDIQELIGNNNYRRRILKSVDNKLSRSSKNFWRTFEDSSHSEQKDLTRSVLSRLSAFLGSPHIELLTCHPHTLDFRKLISDGKIVLIDLHGDEIASEVSTLGAIFLAQFFLASLSLGEIPGNAPPRFYLYVDETQRFITSALPDMFSEARKFGLALTLANQYIGQLDEDTREGIVNNVGTKFSLECSTDEARVTARLFEPHITQQEISSLGLGNAAIRTRWEGQTIDSFVARILPPPHPLSTQSDLEAMKQRSRENLGLISKSEVNTWLDKRYNSDLFRSPSEPDLKDIGDSE